MRKSWNRLLLFCVLSMVQGSHVIHSTRVYNQEALHQFFSFWLTFKGGYSVCIYSDRRLSGAALLPPSMGFNVLNVMGTHAPSPMPLADHSSLFVFVVNILDNLLVRIKSVRVIWYFFSLQCNGKTNVYMYQWLYIQGRVGKNSANAIQCSSVWLESIWGWSLLWLKLEIAVVKFAMITRWNISLSVG